MGAGAVATGFGVQPLGVAAASGDDLPWLARDGNRIVDPECNEVVLRGVNIADPARQSREWRGQTAEETFALATDEDEGWYNRIVRVPCQPQDIAAGVVDSSPADMPHGDEWGPVLPGAFDATDLEWYCETFLDPLVELGRERGAYVMLDYHRHYPVFHQMDQRNHGVPSDVWQCTATGGEDWRYPEVCGERGVLWHGEDQVDDVWAVIDEQEMFERGGPRAWIEDEYIFLEPPEISTALDDEVRLFWTVVADRYAEESHVVFDVYNQPTGPYEDDWGGPDRHPAGPLLPPLTPPPELDLRYDDNQAWWDLWRERAQPWVDVVEAHAPGHLVTIGSPRRTQYTYWAPEGEFEAENMCYSAHTFTEEELRPLDDYFGEPAEQVPVFFSAFGWLEGGGLLVDTPWMDCTSTGNNDPDTADCEPFIEEFEAFFETSPVHPIAWCFDHTWEPNFFDREESVDGAWVLRPGNESAGRWWQVYLEARATDDQPQASGGSGRGTEPCPDEPPSIRLGEYVAQDLDDDGLHEDVNGNGNRDFQDVVAFFEEMNSDGVQNNVSAFDFNDNGGIDFDDLVALFEEV